MKRDVIPPCLLLGLCLLFMTIQPHFATSDNLLNLLRQAAVLALAASGQALVIAAGAIDLSAGSVVALVTVVAALIAKQAGILAGFAAGLALGTLLGAANGLLVARFGVPAFLATIGMYFLARGLAYYLGGGLPVEFLPAGYGTLGGGYLWGVPVPVWVVGVAGLGVHLFVTRSVPGRWLLAAGGNPRAARLSGVRVPTAVGWAFTLAGLLTGLAGLVLSSRVLSGQPAIATGLQFEAIAAVAIGGTSLRGGEGSMARTALGVLTLAVLSNGLTLINVSTFVQDMLVGAILVVFAAADGLPRFAHQL